MLRLFVLACAVCMAYADGECPSDWTFYEDGATCFKTYSSKKTFADARATCQESEADLATDKDAGSHDVIKGLMSSGVGKYWIGVYDPDKTRTFIRVSGEPLGDFHPWSYKEPNNYRNNEYCVEIRTNHGGNWNDQKCTTKRPFVCQKDAVLGHALTTNFDDVESDRWSMRGVALSDPASEADHTTGTGYFLKAVIEKNRYKMFRGRTIVVDKPSCLTYWYECEGKCQIYVYQDRDEIDYQENTEPSATTWRQGYAYMQTKSSTRVQFAIKTTGATETRWVGIDDIVLTDKPCNELGFDG